jgi:hypothetical protein
MIENKEVIKISWEESEKNISRADTSEHNLHCNIKAKSRPELLKPAWRYKFCPADENVKNDLREGCVPCKAVERSVHCSVSGSKECMSLRKAGEKKHHANQDQ